MPLAGDIHAVLSLSVPHSSSAWEDGTGSSTGQGELEASANEMAWAAAALRRERRHLVTRVGGGLSLEVIASSSWSCLPPEAVWQKGGGLIFEAGGLQAKV